MPISKEEKLSLVKKFGRNENDTGYPEVQIAILSKNISKLTSHLIEHKKDNHSRRGLMFMVSERRGLLDYVKKLDNVRYKNVIEALNIRR